MDKPMIMSEKQLEGGWLFEVRLGSQRHQVGLSNGYWQELTEGKLAPGELVKRSFEFLLQHEPASAIMSRFELPIIQNHFSDYETTIRQSLQ